MPKGVRTRSQSQVAKGKSRTSSTAKSPSSKAKGGNKAEKLFSSSKSKHSKSSNNEKTNNKRAKAVQLSQRTKSLVVVVVMEAKIANILPSHLSKRRKSRSV
jgi:hypothetical protein